MLCKIDCDISVTEVSVDPDSRFSRLEKFQVRRKEQRNAYTKTKTHSNSIPTSLFCCYECIRYRNGKILDDWCKDLERVCLVIENHNNMASGTDVPLCCLTQFPMTFWLTIAAVSCTISPCPHAVEYSYNAYLFPTQMLCALLWLFLLIVLLCLVEILLDRQQTTRGIALVLT